MAPLGERLASIESNSSADQPKEAHGRIVVRSARSGAILGQIDPCAACKYSGLAFAPDGRLLRWPAKREDQVLALWGLWARIPSRPPT